MQLDMHYYGTYAMARAAGINKEAAEIIATAAQFVDDNAAGDAIKFQDGGRFYTEATAHHTFDGANLNRQDQRSVWVPFHFLPGAEGNSYTEKLMCKKNSEVVEKVLNYTLAHYDAPYALELLGITAHIYADTFSHYDFSGVSSRKNIIEDSSLSYVSDNISQEIQDHLESQNKKYQKAHRRETSFLDNIKGWFAGGASGGLGHAGACEYPDRPYLQWSFVRDGVESTHDNPQNFIEACEALYTLFKNFADSRPDIKEQPRDFSEIKDDVFQVLSTPGTMEERIELWQQACNAGQITHQAESIPLYSDEGWNDERTDLHRGEHSSVALDQHVYKFYQASAHMRTYILRDLLPSHGLVVA